VLRMWTPKAGDSRGPFPGCHPQPGARTAYLPEVASDSAACSMREATASGRDT